MDQPVSAFAGLIFHLEEGGGSAANRSITERARDSDCDEGRKKEGGRGFGCRRTAAAAERHDAIEG